MAKMTNKRRWDLLGLRIWSNRHAQLDNWAESKLYEFREAKAVGRLTFADLEDGRTPLMLAAERLKEQGDQELAEELLKYVVITSKDHEPPKKRNSKYALLWPTIFLFSERVWKNPEHGISVTAMEVLIRRAWVKCGHREEDLPHKKVIEDALVEKYKNTRPLFTTKERLRTEDLDEYTLAPIRQYKKQGGLS